MFPKIITLSLRTLIYCNFLITLLNTTVIVVILLVNPNISYSQNLISNPSFEQFDSCPNTAGLINSSKFWFNPTLGSPDYFNSCFDTLLNTIAYVSVPANYIGSQTAKTGVAYVGIFTFYLAPFTFREYIETKLTDSLIANQKYYITFYYSLADSSNYATDVLGVYFSTDTIQRNDYDAFGFNPNVETQQGIFLNDKQNWIKFYGEYVATGGEKFLTIGNFKNDSNSDTIRLPFGGNNQNSDFNSSYIFIEDVCLSIDSTNCALTGIIENNKRNEISIYPSPAYEFINIESKCFLIESVELFNMLGEAIYSSHKSRSLFMRIDLKHISEGVYVLKIITNKMVNSKIIVVKH